MKEQIEKHELSESIYMSGYGLERKDCDDIAEQLYYEGYRKQSKPISCGHENGVEWISVEDRLPDKYGDVICFTRKGTIWQVTYNPTYKLFNVSYDNVENAMDVTHWMPLPQPPEMKGGAE